MRRRRRRIRIRGVRESLGVRNQNQKQKQNRAGLLVVRLEEESQSITSAIFWVRRRRIREGGKYSEPEPDAEAGRAACNLSVCLEEEKLDHEDFWGRDDEGESEPGGAWGAGARGSGRSS